jgi:hypothetical protein
MKNPTDELLVLDQLSETQALSLGDVACFGHPLMDAIHDALDLYDFDIDEDGMITLLPVREPVLH